jgi:hypothetical protein
MFACYSSSRFCVRSCTYMFGQCLGAFSIIHPNEVGRQEVLWRAAAAASLQHRLCSSSACWSATSLRRALVLVRSQARLCMLSSPLACCQQHRLCCMCSRVTCCLQCSDVGCRPLP